MKASQRLHLAKTTALVSLAAISLTLTACSPPSTMRATILGGKPAFAVCQGLVSNGIAVSTFDTASPDSNDLVDVWYLFSLETSIAVGTVFVVGEPAEGFREDLAFDQRFLDDSLKYVSVSIRTTRGPFDSAQFELSGLAEGSWMDSQGGIHSEPC